VKKGEGTTARDAPLTCNICGRADGVCEHVQPGVVTVHGKKYDITDRPREAAMPFDDGYSRVTTPADASAESKLYDKYVEPGEFDVPLQVGVDKAVGPDVSVAARGYVNEGKFELFTFSLIDHCSECGSKDFDKPGRLPDGRECHHPYRAFPLEK
jgi:hypothetical protein